MSWENILKNDLKNQIDEYDKTQDKSSGPLIIYLSTAFGSPVGPHPKANRVFFVNNQEQFNKLKQLYSQTNTVKEKNKNAFMVMD